jgi:hypothetical protein
MKLMTGDRKNSCNHHHRGDHHNSMPGRVQWSGSVRECRSEIDIYIKQKTKKGMHIELYCN